MSRETEVESKVKDFYDRRGWTQGSDQESVDAVLWEDLRAVAAPYVSQCRRRVLKVLPASGERLLDAASGPVQYPEYLEYHANFSRRVCVDISESALKQAEAKLGGKGEYVCASILELPLADKSIDAAVSLHTIYHIEKGQQEPAVRQLIRVLKPGAKLIVVYANPLRLSVRLRMLVGRAPERTPSAGEIYYFAHELGWWHRYEDSCTVRFLPWRFFTAGESRRIIPGGFLGRLAFGLVSAFEGLFPGLAVKLGAYPMIVLTKRG